MGTDRPKFALCDFLQYGRCRGTIEKPCTFAHNLWAVDFPEPCHHVLWRNTTESILQNGTCIGFDYWIGQRYLPSQISRLKYYLELHDERFDGDVPAWADLAGRFYLYRNPRPMSQWDVRDAHQRLERILPIYTPLLESSLFTRLDALRVSTTHFWSMSMRCTSRDDSKSPCRRASPSDRRSRPADSPDLSIPEGDGQRTEAYESDDDYPCTESDSKSRSRSSVYVDKIASPTTIEDRVRHLDESSESEETPVSESMDAANTVSPMLEDFMEPPSTQLSLATTDTTQTDVREPTIKKRPRREQE